MNEIAQAIVEVLRKGPATSREILEALSHQGLTISQPTLSRRMTSLEGDRLVRVEGKGRATKYFYDDLNEYFKVPPERRRAVGYNRAILDDYIPNETAWLSSSARRELHSAGGERKLDASTYSKAIAQKLLVDLAYASSNMEGNTYTYLDTKVLVEYGQAAAGKAAEETQMILNHKEAIVYLIDNISEIDVDVREVRTTHALLSRGLIHDDAVGRVRSRIVNIGGSAYTPMAIPQLLEDEMAKLVSKAGLIDDPFERSLFLMVMISYLQYFEDVNKRTGRVACNIPLLKSGLAPLSFMSMDKSKYTRGLLTFYELGRVDLIADAYIEAYTDSANRYDAYFGRDPKNTEIEFRRRADLYEAVQRYIRECIDRGVRLPVVDYLSSKFVDDDEDTATLLRERVAAIIRSLHEGNHVAYGVHRRTFDEYERLAEEVVTRSAGPR